MNSQSDLKIMYIKNVELDNYYFILKIIYKSIK